MKAEFRARPGEKQGYMPSYVRNDLTDALHECFVPLLLIRPVANSHVQRPGLIQMKIGVDAVPAGALRRASPGRKGGAVLSWPDVAAGVGGGKRQILPPPRGLIHKI